MAIHGVEQVGLLTGDNSINGDAPVVVMTTEVLRNMIYGRSGALDRLGVVVLDEVHYLQDTYRGPVWEEVIIHLPADVELVCLSATVSNAEELADWISTVRGPTAAIIEERRPVQPREPLPDRRQDLGPAPPLPDARGRPAEPGGGPPRRRGRARLAGRQPAGQRARRRLYTPRRVEVVERLDAEAMLPAIYFIFSRNACDEAAQTCLDAGLRLTTGPERDRIREIVGRAPGLAGRSRPGRPRLRQVPRRARERHRRPSRRHGAPVQGGGRARFVEGLVKVVFATETLALGINMPARSVVIEKLSKFSGEHHTFLTPGDYTQLTGRAGRRGIDTLGFAMVLWSPFVPFEQVASLASSRSFHLRSAFRPDVQHGRQPRAFLRHRAGSPHVEPLVRAVPGRP